MIEYSKQTIRSVLRKVRRFSDNNLFWWQGPPYNAGDWVGPFLFKAITSKEPVYRISSNRSLTTVFLTVGSLTRWICEDAIVWGSGLLDTNEIFWRPYKTLAVRGPYTRNRFLELGYSCPSVYGDPAILLPKYFQPERKISYRVGIIPHYTNINDAKNLFGDDAEIIIIDIRNPLELVLQNILSCDYIVSSSLHGLIFAHSYGIPAGHIEFTSKPGGDGIKFLDYYASGSIKSPTKQLIIRNKMPTIELEQFAKESLQPNLQPLIEPLLKACPFRLA